MTDINILLNGFRKFRELYYGKSPSLYQDLIRHGQKPRFAVLACSDSRVDPAIVLQTEPGDIFAVRNVAALVPPFEEDGLYHGTSAALEFAVRGLHVEHIIIIGHAHCGGVASMIRKQGGGKELVYDGGTFIGAWTDLLRDAYERAVESNPELKGDALLSAAERQAVRLSLDNLMTFPFIREAVSAGELTLQGWYLNIFDGALEIWNPEGKRFKLVD